MRKCLRVVPAALVGAALVMTTSPPGMASSHREAPNILTEPLVDNTDVYAFVSPDRPDTVTLIANWLPFQEPAGGPNFYPFSDTAQYDINIDNNGDAEADVIYRWTFDGGFKNEDTFLYNTGVVENLDDADLNFFQTYTLERIRGGDSEELLTNVPVAPSRVGDASMPNYASLRDQAITPFGAGGLSFAGQADDPFFLDLRVFDLLYGGDLSEVGNDTLDGYNVNSVAIQVPADEVAEGGDATANPIIGMWSTTSRPSMEVLNADGSVEASGDMVQVSRLGSPLVNEVVVPVGSKDLFNSSEPSGDSQFLDRVQNPEVPRLIEAIYGIPAPPTPRADLVSVFLTGVEGLNMPEGVTPSEMVRLNTSIAPTSNPDRLGVIGGDNQGFPNGRRLVDDVVDIELQVLEGELLNNPNDIGDAVNANDLPFGDSFPYLALPHSGSDVTVGTGGSGGGRQGQAGTAAGQPNVPRGAVAAGGGGTAGNDVPLVPLAVAAVGLSIAAIGGGSRFARSRRRV
jgi:hypothetical protein